MSDRLGSSNESLGSDLELSASLWVKLGKEESGQDHHAKAVEAYHKATEVDPEHDQAWFLLAYSYGQLGRNREAIAAIKQSIRIDRNYHGSWYNLGLYYLRTGATVEASKAFDEALSCDATYRPALRSLIKCHQKRGDIDKELTARRTIVTLEDATLDDWHDLADALLRNKDYDDCVRTNRVIVDRDPNNASAPCRIGVAFEAMGKQLDAADWYHAALRLQNDHGRSLTGLSRVEEVLLADAIHIQKAEASKEQKPPTGYVNPYTLLQAGVIPREGLRTKEIQAMKTKVLHELKLEGGVLSWLGGDAIDASRVHAVVAELEDPQTQEHHQQVYENQPLHDLLTRGKLSYFCYNGESAQNKYSQDFLKWVTPLFADPYERELFAAYEAGDRSCLQALCRGRVLMDPDLGEGAHTKIRHHLSQCEQRLSAALDRFKVDPTEMGAVADCVDDARPELMGLMPVSLQDEQSKLAGLVRAAAITAMNEHEDEQLADDLIRHCLRFEGMRSDLRHRIDEDAGHVVGRCIASELRARFGESSARKYPLQEVEQVLASVAAPQLEELTEAGLPQAYDACVAALRRLSIDMCNEHNDLELSQGILELCCNYPDMTDEAWETYKSDTEALKGLVEKERENDVNLAFGSRTFTLNKKTVQFGERVIECQNVVGLRWGIIDWGHKLSLSVHTKGDRGDTIEVSWTSSKDDIEGQRGHFIKILNAFHAYIVPGVLDRIMRIMRRGDAVKMGELRLSQSGIGFSTQGLLWRSKRHIDWENVVLKHEAGIVHVRSKADARSTTTVDPSEVWNACLLERLQESLQAKRDSVRESQRGRNT
jgi:tetratricopeptide (TPR) repeat protein